MNLYLTAYEAGKVGGNMVKRMVEIAEKQLRGNVMKNVFGTSACNDSPLK